MPRGRQTDILTAAKVAALAELGYSAPQIEALTGVNARTGKACPRLSFKANKSASDGAVFALV